MSKILSKHLYEVLKEWKRLTKEDHPPLYVRQYGLCSSVLCIKVQLYPYLTDVFIGDELTAALQDDFKTSHVPFHRKEELYTESGYKGTQHLNKRRHAWVDMKLKQYEDRYYKKGRRMK